MVNIESFFFFLQNLEVAEQHISASQAMPMVIIKPAK